MAKAPNPEGRYIWPLHTIGTIPFISTPSPINQLYPVYTEYPSHCWLSVCRFHIKLSTCLWASFPSGSWRTSLPQGIPCHLVGSMCTPVQSHRSTGREVSAHPAVRDVGDCSLGVCTIDQRIGTYLPKGRRREKKAEPGEVSLSVGKIQANVLSLERTVATRGSQPG